jgi:hypothetical protein
LFRIEARVAEVEREEGGAGRGRRRRRRRGRKRRRRRRSKIVLWNGDIDPPQVTRSYSG